MATYDLVCRACGHVLEIYVQGFLKDEDKRCPACGSFEVRQKFGPFLTGVGDAASSCSQPANSGFG